MPLKIILELRSSSHAVRKSLSHLYQIVDRLSNGMITDVQLIQRLADVRQIMLGRFLVVRLKRIER